MVNDIKGNSKMIVLFYAHSSEIFSLVKFAANKLDPLIVNKETKRKEKKNLYSYFRTYWH